MSWIGETGILRALVVHPGAELYGSDRVLKESVAGLIGAGYQAVVVLPQPGPLAKELRSIGATVRYARTLILRKSLMSPAGLPRLFWDAIRGTIAGWRAIRRVNPDVIFINTVTMPLWPVLAWLRGIPSLTHVHEAEANAADWVNRLIYLSHHLSRTMIVNSRFSRGVIAQVYPRLAARSRVIYNGVPGPATVSQSSSELPQPLRLLFIGRLSPRKGADLMVDATGLLRSSGISVETTLLGAVFDGYEWFEEQLYARRAELDLEDEVSLVGFHPSIWPFLEACDILVVPSRFDEPFGNTAVEGALAARATVVSDTSGLREATSGMTSATLVSPGSAQSIVDAVHALMENWPVTVTNAGEDREQALQRYSLSRYREEIAWATQETLVGSS